MRTIAAGLSSLRLVAGGSTLEQVFDAIAAPVLVIHGGRDRTVPASQAAAVAERRPDWRDEILADLGHLPHLEEPDRWCGLVEAWWPLTAPS